MRTAHRDEVDMRLGFGTAAGGAPIAIVHQYIEQQWRPD
jgi:hypothetical protein